MKKVLFSIAIVICLISSQCTGQEVKKKARDIKGFTRISYGISGVLDILIGPKFKVILEGEIVDMEKVVTEVSGDRLIIRLENWRTKLNEDVSVYITMPELKELGVSGSGFAEILDTIRSADKLNLSVNGSGGIVTTNLEADNLDCSISGSGKIIIGRGTADSGDISISGSGSYTGATFEIDHLKVSISGSGNCLCKVGDSLKAAISGSGNVTYKGDPEIDASVSGSGHVQSMK
jgi:hypothetical protein